MALNEYLAEEIRLDHAEGHMSRREALRLLGLLGVGLTTARAWLDDSAADAATKSTVARKGPAKKKAPAKEPTAAKTSTTTRPPTTVPADPTKGALAAQAITFPGTAGTLRASFAAAEKPLGAVLIIHENRGLTDHFKALPGRFARDGYSALAIDLASRVGGTDAVASQMPAPLANAKTEDLVADMKSALDELARRTPGAKLGITGFCFGGGMVWSLLNAGDRRISAAVPFYGTGPSRADFRGSPDAAVLAVYAERDSRVNANRPAMTAALEQAKLTHEFFVAAGADHAFFNDTGARYDPKQATLAYSRLLEWFGRYLA